MMRLIPVLTVNVARFPEHRRLGVTVPFHTKPMTTTNTWFAKIAQKAAKATEKGVKKGANKTAEETEKGAKKVKEKTEDH